MALIQVNYMSKALFRIVPLLEMEKKQLTNEERIASTFSAAVCSSRSI